MNDNSVFTPAEQAILEKNLGKERAAQVIKETKEKTNEIVRDLIGGVARDLIPGSGTLIDKIREATND